MKDKYGLRIECGDGSFAVGSGTLEGKPCLTVCNDGTGIIGEQFERDEPNIPHDIEVFTVAFGNASSVNVWINQLIEVRKMFEKVVDIPK